MANESILKYMFQIIEDLGRYNDIQTLMEKLLFEARKYTKAEAGTIFLFQDGTLHFSYLQNDALFHSFSDNKYQYVIHKIPVNCDSIVGYVAQTGRMLAIDDVYNLHESDCPYHFNDYFDQQTGYRTKSMLTFPLTTGRGELIGVFQLINAKDDEHRTVPFSESSKQYLPLFAFPAAEVVRRTQMNRNFIMRMIQMAQLHDPFETGSHVNRVGNYSAEIYHKWALQQKLDFDQIKRNKDSIRLAAMLHDVGKVAISDVILKKPGKLTKEEFEQIKEHTVRGSELFSNPKTDLETMAYNVVLNHHEKWNGKGYPGLIETTGENASVQSGHGKKEDEIPLEGRITAIADVYDALSSDRVYKKAWPEEKIKALLWEERGESFDPKLIDIFFDIHEVILAIKEKYQDRVAS